MYIQTFKQTNVLRTLLIRDVFQVRDDVTQDGEGAEGNMTAR